MPPFGVGRDRGVFFPHLPFSQEIQTEIGDDAVDPGVERTLKAEVVNVPVRLEERFLVNILRVLLVAGQMVSQAQHGAVVLAHEILERGAIPALCFPDQLRVIHAASGLPHYIPSLGGYCGRRLLPRLRSTEYRGSRTASLIRGLGCKSRANREGNCYRFGRHAGFYLTFAIANQFLCLQLHRRARQETVSEL